MSTTLQQLANGLRQSRGLAHKCDIASVVSALGIDGRSAVAVGDDCAAIADGDGYLLFAIEGFINAFVQDDPWFAGWCGIMVNVSDIYAMGGRPIAVVDAVWDRNCEAMKPVLDGMAAASRSYGVPIVGGHSNARSEQAQLAVAILGRAKNLLTSFDAKSGEYLVAAIDLRASYREPYPHWNATTGVDPQRLRDDLELLPRIADAGLCRAAKDISQAGLLGTALMLLECSGVGAQIDIDEIPRPEGVDLSRWLLSTFPSYGFLLSVAECDLNDVLGLFRKRDIACAAIGRIDDQPSLRLRSGDEQCTAWQLDTQPVIGCMPQLLEQNHA